MRSLVDHWGFRFNRIIFIVLIVMSVVGMLGAGVAFRWWSIPLYASFGVYVCALVVLVEWGILRIVKRAPPAVPAVPPLPRRFWGHRTLLLALIAFVVFITASREGSFAPNFVLTINRYQTRTVTNVRTQTNSVSHHTGARGIRLAGRPVACLTDCDPSASTVCRTLLSKLRCKKKGTASNATFIQLHVRAGGEPSCYFPLYKSASLSFGADATISASSRGAKATHTMTLNGTIRLKMTGIGSCYTFRQVLGAEMARQITQELNKFLHSH